MNCQYVKDHYGVPAAIGRKVIVRGRHGVIAEDRGNYIGVTFDDSAPTDVFNVHPTDHVEYGEMGKVRKLNRSQRRYQDYIKADCGYPFSEWLQYHFKRKAPQHLNP